jgi:hypothetical protein
MLQTEQTRGMHHIIISGTREPQQTIACELSFYLNLQFLFLTIDQLTSHHGSPGKPQRGHRVVGKSISAISPIIAHPAIGMTFSASMALSPKSPRTLNH